jgi:hypothetical protein
MPATAPRASLDHAHKHRGVGATLLDGRQIAVLAHTFRGDHDTAATLLSDTITPENWQQAATHVSTW